MRTAPIAVTLAAVACLWPVASGREYLRFMGSFKWWLVASLFLWSQVLAWAIRRAHAMALGRPGARLAASHAAVGTRDTSLRSPIVAFAAAAGALAAQLIAAQALYPALDGSAAFSVLRELKPRVARYAVELIRWGLRIGCPATSVGLANFLCIQMGDGRNWRVTLSVLPLQPDCAEPLLVLGEASASRGCNAGWLSIGARGMHTGILVTGLPGTGKTEGCIYPWIRQLLAPGGGEAIRLQALGRSH